MTAIIELISLLLITFLTWIIAHSTSNIWYFNNKHDIFYANILYVRRPRFFTLGTFTFNQFQHMYYVVLP